LALKQEEQEQEQNNNLKQNQKTNKKRFFIVRQKNGKHNTWSPIAHYNDSGNFLGLAELVVNNKEMNTI
jgi:hypothetical protein